MEDLDEFGRGKKTPFKRRLQKMWPPGATWDRDSKAMSSACLGETGRGGEGYAQPEKEFGTAAEALPKRSSCELSLRHA